MWWRRLLGRIGTIGIYPTTSSNISSGSNNARTIFNSSNLGRLSTSPGCGSPILSSGIDGNATSMLPTPHSPSPLLQGNKGTTHFAFPPTNFWQDKDNNSNGYGFPGGADLLRSAPIQRNWHSASQVGTSVPHAPGFRMT